MFNIASRYCPTMVWYRPKQYAGFNRCALASNEVCNGASF